MQFKKRISAFTLIELLVTIVVIGMLSSISVATYNGYISSAKVATIKKTVNDLYRFTILYARETDSYYDEISLAEVLDKFRIKNLGYGNITYVVLGQTDFYYQATLPNGETWTLALVPTVYAENSSFYAKGTQNAMNYFKSLDDGQRSNVIRATYDEVVLKELKNDALKAGFDLTFVSSPWTQIMPDLDKDLVPDYRDDCPKISGPKNNKGCPLVDTDGDGVYDKDDQCPNVAGDKYAWGCIIETENITIKLTSCGSKKINVIKAVRSITGLGLREAKNLVEAVPSVIKSGVSVGEAQEIKIKIEAAGGTVNYKGQENSGGDNRVIDSGVSENIIIKLTSYGAKKINVIKAVRSVTGLGLKESKRIIDTIPSVIKSGISVGEAQEIKTKIEAAGGTVNYKEQENSGDDGIVENDIEKVTVLGYSGTSNRIPMIKTVRSITGLGLKEAKNFVESLPMVIKENITLKESEDIKNKIEEAGGIVSIKKY